MRASIAKLGSHWYVLKLSSMSTIMREWAAIHCLAHMPLREVLLSGQVRRCRQGLGSGRVSGSRTAAARGWLHLPNNALLNLPLDLDCHLCALLHPLVAPQPSQSLLAARGKLEVPPQMRAQMQKTYNDSQASAAAASVCCLLCCLALHSTAVLSCTRPAPATCCVVT